MTFINTYTTKFSGLFSARLKILLATAGILLLSLLFACHSIYGGRAEPDAYTIGATVTGHTGEVFLTLTYGDDNKTETLNVPTGTENFTFGAKLVDNQSFTLSVTAPTGQTCRSSRTQGTIVDANITDIEVICLAIPTYSIGGMVSGLANGENITLTLSPTDGTAETKDITGDADDTSDDNFAFDTRLVNGVTYTVTTTSPASKTCTVNNAGPQMMGDADVTDVTVACVAIATYSVGGAVSGLTNGETITLTLSPTGGTAETEDITADADGTSDDNFAFDTRLVNGDTYTITTTSPAGKTCTVNNAGQRMMGGADVTDISVTCVATYSIGGAVSGLANGETITLTLSPIGGTAEDKNITGDNDGTSNDTFTFDTRLVNGATYAVTTSQPIGKACTVDNTGTRTMADANVTNIAVTCITAAYSVSGTVTGVADTRTILVILMTYDDTTRTSATRRQVRAGADGTFSFTAIPANKFYVLQANPDTIGATCIGPSTTPTQITGDVTGAMVTCTASTHTGPYLNVLVISYAHEVSLVTVNLFVSDIAVTDTSGTPDNTVSGSDADVIINTNYGSLDINGFSYDLAIDANKYYAITATSPNETCTIQNGSGAPASDSRSVSISCN